MNGSLFKKLRVAWDVGLLKICNVNMKRFSIWKILFESQGKLIEWAFVCSGGAGELMVRIHLFLSLSLLFESACVSVFVFIVQITFIEDVSVIRD